MIPDELQIVSSCEFLLPDASGIYRDCVEAQYTCIRFKPSHGDPEIAKTLRELTRMSTARRGRRFRACAYHADLYFARGFTADRGNYFIRHEISPQPPGCVQVTERARIAVDVHVGNVGIGLLLAAGHFVVVEAAKGEADREWFARAVAARASVVISADRDLELLCHDKDLVFFRARGGHTGRVTAERFVQWWPHHLRTLATIAAIHAEQPGLV